MGSVFGKNIKLSLFGESHGEAIGCVIDGFPHGIKIDGDFIELEMERRRAKNPSISTARNEKDKVEILSGLLEKIENKDIKDQIRMMYINSKENAVEDIFKNILNQTLSIFKQPKVKDFIINKRN